jgi:hypothetical protein
VAVPPASEIRVSADAVEGRDVLVGEDAGENVADVAPDAMDGEDVETLVDAEEVLVPRGVEAADCGDEPDNWGDVDADCAVGVSVL